MKNIFNLDSEAIEKAKASFDDIAFQMGSSNSKELNEEEAIKAANVYIERGWTCPFPLPVGEKFPPPKNVTGNIPDPEPEFLIDLWDKTEDLKCNLAIRAQNEEEDFDVISIDIDEYGQKRGWQNIQELMKKIGIIDFDLVPRSTRRDRAGRSGQYFFKVPAGTQLNGKVCSDVEVVQRTHRYACVWPSIVKGSQYRWYLGSQFTGVPYTKDLPYLPDEWIKYLSNNKTKRKKTKSTFNGAVNAQYEAAMIWLSERINNWKSKGMSDRIKDRCEGELFEEALAGNAHDTMNSNVLSIIFSSADGHSGGHEGLSILHDKFIDEVVNNRKGASYRSESQAEHEFQSSVVGAVEHLKTDIDNGKIILWDDKDLDMAQNLAPDILSTIVKMNAGRLPKGVNLDEYVNTDRGNAQMFFDYWGRNILATNNKEEAFAVWDNDSRRYIFRHPDQMFEAVYQATSARILYEVNAMKKTLYEVVEQELRGQLNPDMPDQKELEAKIEEATKWALSLQQTSRQRYVLAQLRSVAGIEVDMTDFDSIGTIIGDSEGNTINLDKIDGDSVEKSFSVKKDMLTQSAGCEYVPGYSHKGWDQFLNKFIPDKEKQRFVQKVFGYALEEGNPEKVLVCFQGESNTGKTTIIEAVANALGNYAGTTNATTLLRNGSDRPSPELLTNMKTRMLFLSELSRKHKLSAAEIKRITGNDTIQVRGLWSNRPLQAVPSFTPFVSTNEAPTIDDADEALSRRILVVPFTDSHSPSKVSYENDVIKNKDIKKAILNWVVEGYILYKKEGLSWDSRPQSSRDASKEMYSEFSIIVNFIDDMIEPAMQHDEDGTQIPMVEENIWSSWRMWIANMGMKDEDRISRRELRKMLKSNGFNVKRTTRNGRNEYVYTTKPKT